MGREGERNERKKEKQRKEEEVRRKQSREKELSKWLFFKFLGLLIVFLCTTDHQ